jgi:hypothetical protein
MATTQVMKARGPLLILAVLLACAAPASAETYRGTLDVQHMDNFAGGTVKTQYALVDDGRRTPLRPTVKPAAPSGTLVKVTGDREGGVITGRVQATGSGAQAYPAQLGQHETLVLLINFADDTREPWTKDEVRESIFTNPDSANAFFQDESHGQIELTGVVRADGDVTDWMTIGSRNGLCDINQIYHQGIQAATTAGIDVWSYDHLLFTYPALPNCGFAGAAMVPGNLVWLNGDLRTRVVAHEVGHNMGLHHANGYACTENGAPVAISSTCTSGEYGDPYDVMGNSASNHNNSWHLEKLGTLGAGNVKTITTSGTYTLASARDQDPDAVQSIRIPRRRDAGGAVLDYYYLEVREAGGLFETFSYFYDVYGKDGVSIRLNPDPVTMTQSNLIDTTPGSDWWHYDAPLAAGKTFSDGSVSVTTDSVADGEASVTISVPEPPAPPPPPPPSTGTGSGTPKPPAPAGRRPTPPAPVVTTPRPAADVKPPAVRVLSPRNLRKLRRRVNIRAAATDDRGVARMELWIDGKRRKVVKAAELRYRWSIRPGRHRIEVRAFDAAGNRSRLKRTAVARRR